MSEHKDAVFFDEAPHGLATDSVKAAYRELRLWQKGYLAAVAGRHPEPAYAAEDFVRGVNDKRSQLLGG